MSLIKKIGSFWIIILGWMIVGYFCSFNREWVSIIIPHLQEIRIKTSEGFLWAFAAGTFFTFFFFSVEFGKKSHQIRKLKKRVRELEESSSEPQNKVPTQEMASLSPQELTDPGVTIDEENSEPMVEGRPS